MSSVPRYNTRTNPSSVWRDALGPGFAVSVSEGLVKVAGDAAVRPYRFRRL